MVALADVVVHRVVTGRDLQRAGAEVHLHRVVADDGQLPADERKGGRLADELLETRVLRVDRDAGVGQHRLRSHGGDGHIAATVDRIFDVVEDVVVRLPLDLEV